MCSDVRKMHPQNRSNKIHINKYLESHPFHFFFSDRRNRGVTLAIPLYYGDIMLEIYLIFFFMVAHMAWTKKKSPNRGHLG